MKDLGLGLRAQDLKKRQHDPQLDPELSKKKSLRAKAKKAFHDFLQGITGYFSCRSLG